MRHAKGTKTRESEPPAAPGRLRRPLLRLDVLTALVTAIVVLVCRLWTPARPNVLLVTIDTLRADHVGAYGSSAAATPSLNGLAARGVRFENAVSAAPITGPSHATILTGFYPPVSGVRDNVTFVLDGRHATLAMLLKRRGYRTAAFVAAYPLATAFGFGQGFDVFSEGFHSTPALGEGAERPGNEVADAALEWLAKPGGEPFFLWLHFYDPHAPYAPPPPYSETFRDRPYDGEIAFVDAQLGRVLRALADSGREDRTLVVALADHGEALGDHGEATHAILVYQSTLHVPLVFAGPRVPRGRISAARVGTVDVMPTILDLLGLETPSSLPGRSLVPALRGQELAVRPLYFESLFGRLNCRWSSLRGWLVGDWKLVLGSAPELYDLATDPGEARNRADAEPERVRAMSVKLRAAVAMMAPNGDATRMIALSSEQEERLRSLGYVGGGAGFGDLDQPGLPDPRTHVRLFERLQVALIAHGPAISRALADAIEIARQDPSSPFAHFTLASLAYRSGQFELADRSFARTLELDPDRPGMRHYYGRLLREMGRAEDSEHQLRIALAQLATDDAATRLNLAETLIALGKLDEAEALIAKVTEQEPRLAEARGAKGRLLLARGKPWEAVPLLEAAAIGLEAEPWIDLARVYLSVGDGTKARQAAAEALSRNQSHPWAIGVLGHALILEGRRAEGIALLRRAVALHPRRPQAWSSLADAFDAAGDASSAAMCRKRSRPMARRAS